MRHELEVSRFNRYIEYIKLFNVGDVVTLILNEHQQDIIIRDFTSEYIAFNYNISSDHSKYNDIVVINKTQFVKGNMDLYIIKSDNVVRPTINKNYIKTITKTKTIHKFVEFFDETLIDRIYNKYCKWKKRKRKIEQNTVDESITETEVN